MSDYSRLLIADCPRWKIFLHENQYYLGHCYIWAKREGLVDLMDTTEEERRDLFNIGEGLKHSLMQSFAPDLFNWACFGNNSAQCHLHVIPRYRSPRTFGGREFVDDRWGKNHAPYDDDFSVSEEILQEIKLAVKGSAF